MKLPSLNALRAFDVVARLESMAAVATELRVTTSAVSRQVANLEENLGIALPVRNGRGVRLSQNRRRTKSDIADVFENWCCCRLPLFTVACQQGANSRLFDES